MPQLPLTDADGRILPARAVTPRSPGRTSRRTPAGGEPRRLRLITGDAQSTHAALLTACGNDPERLARALIDGDPELQLGLFGRDLAGARQVYLRPDGSLLESARVLRVRYDRSGAEVDRSDALPVAATVHAEAPLPWTGRLLPADTVLHQHVLRSKRQLQPADAEDFAHLHQLASRLAEADRLLCVGGADDQHPLIMDSGGTAWRGFLEGRVDGPAFRLVLHLSDCELRVPEEPA